MWPAARHHCDQAAGAFVTMQQALDHLEERLGVVAVCLHQCKKNAQIWRYDQGVDHMSLVTVHLAMAIQP